MGMRVFVTGVSGFIGRHLLPRLLDKGYDVICYDIKPPVFQGHAYDQTHTIIGDLTSGEGLDEIIWEEVDAVIHLAAAGVKASGRNWPGCVSVNIIGTEQIIHAISRVSPQPLLIYPRTFYENCITETTDLINDPYIVTKTAATKIVELWASNNKSARVIFCTIFQAYGSGDDPGNILAYTANCLKDGVKAKLGSGKGLRDWIYIDDLVDAFIKVLNVTGNNIQYFDFGSGKLTSIKNVVLKLSDLMGYSNDLISFDSNRDRPDTGLMSFAKEFLPEWKANVSLDEGIINYIKDLKA